MSNQAKDKEEIIELFGVHFEKHHNMPPLASRILGTLVINSKEKDLTFEELVTITGASKSSVSTNLHLLLETGKIVYYTKCGDRKKYFKPSSLAERIKNHLTIVKSEQNLIKKIREYQELYNVNSVCENDQKTVELYRDYINQFELLISDFITKIEKLETN